MASLNVIRGLSMESKYHWQLIDDKALETIVYYCDSPLVEVAIAAKMSISPLACILDPKHMKQVSLTETMIDKLNELQISDSNMVIPKEFWNLLNILMFMSSLLENDFIASSMASCIKCMSAIVKIISSTLQLSKNFNLEKEVALSIAFKLALQNKTYLDDKEETMAQVLSLYGSQPSALQTIASCILWKLGEEAISGKHTIITKLKLTM